MSTRQPQKQLEIDAGLDVDSRRLLQRARHYFGVESLDETAVTDAMVMIRQRLARLPKPMRQAHMRQVWALIDDLQGLNRRLQAERERIGAQITRQSQTRTALKAYAGGGSTCLKK